MPDTILLGKEFQNSKLVKEDLGDYIARGGLNFHSESSELFSLDFLSIK